MKLISMTNFVLEEDKKRHIDEEYTSFDFMDSVTKYASFLKQPLELGMFIPVDEDGNVLKEPKKEYYSNEELAKDYFRQDWIEYVRAKEKVLFEGFKYIGERHVGAGKIVIGLGYKNGIHQTIEDLVMYHKSKYLILSKSAIKLL